jgi:5-methylcytosine-specific restriction endonuclease McrA
MNADAKDLINDLVDHVMPRLTPYESSLYLLFVRMTFLNDGSNCVRIGKKRIAKQIGLSSQTSGRISYDQVTKVCKALEEKSCVLVGDTNRDGTHYTVIAPREIPFVIEKIAFDGTSEDDYFNDPLKRQKLYERDKWTCQYCGEKVTEKDATLDHYIPQSKNGDNSKDNLRTCCLICNSIKSGKSFEEAAPNILTNIRERKQKHNA